jgi:WD40 repeat protein/tetratricopeptide (TPR) repeat protein
VAFSPDGKTVWTSSEGNTPRRWDATNGEPLGLPIRLPPQVQIGAVRSHPDGRITLTGIEGNTVRLWDAATGQPIGPRLEYPVTAALAFSPDSKTLITGDAWEVAHLWDLATSQPIGPPLKHQGRVRDAAFSPDGKTILTGSDDGTARLWDAANGKPCVPPLRHEGSVRSVAFSPDGKTVLTGGVDKVARLWDAATGQLISLLDHQGPALRVAFSPDGRTIATGSLDGTVRLWDADPGKPLGHILEVPSTHFIGDLSPIGMVAVTYPLQPNTPVPDWNPITYQPIGVPLRDVQLWDISTGQPIGAPLPQPGGNLTAIFSPDGRVLLTIEANLTAQLWDARTGEATGPAIRMPSWVSGWGRVSHAVAFSPDGSTLLFGGGDRSAWIFDTATGSVRRLTPDPGNAASVVAFSPDGKTFLTGHMNGEVRWWDGPSLTPLGEPFRHNGSIICGLFSPDGRSILIGCEDRTARLWDLRTRKPLIPPLRHQRHIRGLAFSPDGQTIATGCDDKTARLWDAATGQPIGPILRDDTTGHRIAFLADGKMLFVGGSGSPFDRLQGESRLIPVPPILPDQLERVALWVEVITGLSLDKEQGLIQVLDNAAWLERREQLRQLGGPPETGAEQRLDPILFGPDPMARARHFIERKHWDAAEAAFSEASRARPFNLSILFERVRSHIARGQLHIAQGRPEKAIPDFAKAVHLEPENLRLRYNLALALLALGDQDGLRQFCSDVLSHFGTTANPRVANSVAWYCVLGPDAAADRATPVRLAKLAVTDTSEAEKPTFLNTLGAALYRAGRFEDAIHRLEEGIRKRGGKSLPQDWVFLALAHHGLGNRAEARRWLDRLRAYLPDEKPSAFWNELEIRLLRREAEAVIHFDPIFPTDPFAR